MIKKALFDAILPSVGMVIFRLIILRILSQSYIMTWQNVLYQVTFIFVASYALFFLLNCFINGLNTYLMKKRINTKIKKYKVMALVVF